MATLTKFQQDCADAARDMDGLEIPRVNWPDAEAIVAAFPGEFALGSARGPGGDWKRLSVIDGGDDAQ